MTTLEEFKAFFEDYVAASEYIQSVTFVTDYEEILGLQLDNDLYPALVVEMPEVEIKDVAGMEVTFYSAYTLMRGLPRDEKPDFYFDELAGMFPVALDLHKDFFCASEAGELTTDISARLLPIYKATVGNCYGWRGDVFLTGYR